MEIIGRKREQRKLEEILRSKRPEFLAVYGRRRVGKTFLIREYFGGKFSFYATGVANKKTKEQLAAFSQWLKQYGSEDVGVVQNWFDAFFRLKELLSREDVYRDPVSGKRIIFLDELPWMDTARSDFKSTLDMFWNGWASGQPDVLLIVCGSATSWVIDNLIDDTGGFYRRVTRQISMAPFSLLECEELLHANGIPFGRRQIIESYMVMGGIPYYLNAIDKRLSLSQNIDTLLLDERGELHHEYDLLFHSLFKKSEKHKAIIEEIAKKNSGVTRVELAKKKQIGDGEPLTKTLKELEQCDFIRKYHNYTKKKSGFYYRIIDPFLLFYLRYVQDGVLKSWASYKDQGSYYAWRGLAFETVCLNHIPQLKQALGISGVESMEYSWRSEKQKGGAQIDLFIDRKDDVINLCEMKYSDAEFEIDEAYERSLRNKMTVFQEETSVKKALHLTLISAYGLKRNSYSDVVLNVLTADDLFA